MKTRWTSGERMDDQRYAYRDRHCWIDLALLTVQMQEMLDAPHDGHEQTFFHSWPIADFLAQPDLQERLRLWFGASVCEEILAACRATLSQ
jgi:hypothetical protein